MEQTEIKKEQFRLLSGDCSFLRAVFLEKMIL